MTSPRSSLFVPLSVATLREEDLVNGLKSGELITNHVWLSFSPRQIAEPALVDFLSLHSQGNFKIVHRDVGRTALSAYIALESVTDALKFYSLANQQFPGVATLGQPNTHLWVGGLEPNDSKLEGELFTRFSEFGKVSNFRVLLARRVCVCCCLCHIPLLPFTHSPLSILSVCIR